MTFRITRTIVDGQFANDKCFTDWLESFGPPGNGKAHLVDMRIDPISSITGGAVPTLSSEAWGLIVPPIYVAGKLVAAAGQAAANVPKAQQRRYYLWEQEGSLSALDTGPLLKCKSDPDLVSYGGANGWATEAEARKALDAQLAGSAAVVAEVKKANAAAVSAGNVASGVASDIAKDAGKALENATGISAGVIGPIVGVAALVGGGWVLYRLATSGRR